MKRLDVRKILKRTCLAAGGVFLTSAIILAGATWISLKPVESSLHKISSDAQTIRITDRNGIPLGVSYQNRWNSFDFQPLYEMPDFLKTAFIFSEDRNFFDHSGIDWPARLSALHQNLRHREAVRGASTMTEQVVRMINPRPRTVWSRWLEGIEATDLEQGVAKIDILEFYLNQVPYAANRRGVVQASRYYFNRDISTLSPKEMLALVVLVRAPSAYDLYRHPGKIESPLQRLAEAMLKAGKIDASTYEDIRNGELIPAKPSLPVEARHFARTVRLISGQQDTYRTTLDAGLQQSAQAILNKRLERLSNNHVTNAGLMIADHQTGEILAWVVGGADQPDAGIKGGEIDTLTTPRQPGSSLKPFLYARAIDKGWTASTLIDDSPLAEAIGTGLHNFRNYSNTHYGPITLREALGTSLNIPALLTIRHVGSGDYLTILQKLGFQTLNLNSEIYDEGLALGNGEVTLLEMTQAYAALANGGTFKPLHVLLRSNTADSPVRVYSPEAASLIGNILSDPAARRMEFGPGSVLNLPLQTAAKTGTSTDYRDAWTMAYNDKYVVGIWMGNLDNMPMNGITGSTGPALALRSIFSLLNKNRETHRLPFSKTLTAKDVCVRPQKPDGSCLMRTEWFAPGTLPSDIYPASTPPSLELVRPTEGLQIAQDPRIPESHQKFRFEVRGAPADAAFEWMLNDTKPETTDKPYLLWPVSKGQYTLYVRVIEPGKDPQGIAPVTFNVK